MNVIGFINKKDCTRQGAAGVQSRHCLSVSADSMPLCIKTIKMNFETQGYKK